MQSVNINDHHAVRFLIFREREIEQGAGEVKRCICQRPAQSAEHLHMLNMLHQLCSSSSSSRRQLWDISKHPADQGYTVRTVDGLLDGTRCVHKFTVNFWSLGFEAVPSATARPRMIVLFPSSSARSLGKTRGNGYSAFRSAEVTDNN